MQKSLRDFHTSVPGTVVGVDLSKPSVDIQPSVSTDFGDDYKVDTYPVIYGVPLLVYSGNSGKAKITVPVKVGDKAALHFSERNPNDNTDTTTHGMYGCYAVVGMEGEVDPTDIVLQNEISKITLKPDGTIILANGPATITAQPDGNVMVNGLTVTPSGNIITKGGVNLESFYQAYLQHVHEGVSRGNEITNPPR